MYAQVIEGAALPLFGSTIIDAEGTQHPRAILHLWSAEELAAVGIYPVADLPPLAPGEVEVSSGLVWTGTAVERGRTVRAKTQAELDSEREARNAARRQNVNQAAVLRVVAETVLTQAVIDDTLSPEQLASVAVLFAPYEVGKAYKARAVFEHEGVLYEVVQAHTSQADWLPHVEKALYTPHYPAGVIPFWVPPAGSHDAPNIGDERRHNDSCWRSLINGNTTVPGSDPRWWEQFDCPEG